MRFLYGLAACALCLSSTIAKTGQTGNTASCSTTLTEQPDNTTTAVPDIRFIEDFYIGQNGSDPRNALQQPLRSGGRKLSGVTIKPASHPASRIASWLSAKKSAHDVLSDVDVKDHGEIIQSSFPDGAPNNFITSSNGFVNAAIWAYSGHHHLKIRPEDVWLAILTQFSSHINAHAEELRGSFVAHEGKKQLQIVYSAGTRYTVDWADFAEKIGLMIQDNVVDPELRQWILPAFSTTTEQDVVIASIAMMASMQKYFDYGARITCGLPSVTLLGEKADYELILARLDKLRSYGDEPTLFADLLAPIVKRFILSFDEPDGAEVVDFWNHILTSWNMGSGADFYSGWITAFIFWDEDGKVLNGRNYSSIDDMLPPLTLDGITYHRVTADDVPPGFCTVPVTIVDNGAKISAEMLAGSVGMECSSGEQEMVGGEVGLDTMQPWSGWWVYEKAAPLEDGASAEDGAWYE
ncbi:hypothetical protein LTR85_011215 [Meristemomyces frigidus]|nr:hypothetical protein LTR85_011215 [Meristemomyces frigidus]